MLSALIDTEGRVKDVVVLRSLPQLDDSAARAVCCWKYRPARREDGTPVETWLIVTLDFWLHY